MNKYVAIYMKNKLNKFPIKLYLNNDHNEFDLYFMILFPSCLWHRWFNDKTIHSAGNWCSWFEISGDGDWNTWKSRFSSNIPQLFPSPPECDRSDNSSWMVLPHRLKGCCSICPRSTACCSVVVSLRLGHILRECKSHFEENMLSSLASAIDIFMKNIYRLNGHDILRDSNEDWSLALAGWQLFWLNNPLTQPELNFDFQFPPVRHRILRMPFFRPQSQLDRSGSIASIAIRVHHRILNSRSMNK